MNKILILAIAAFALMIAVSANAQTIYDSITCTNCLLDNPIFVNFTFQGNMSDNGKVNKSGDLFDGKFYQNHSTISTYYYWIFDKNGTGFYQHNQFGENILIQFNASEMNNYMPINMNDGNIVNLANPINNQDAATKNYVDTANNSKVNKSGDNLTGMLFTSENSNSKAERGFFVSQNSNGLAGALYSAQKSRGTYENPQVVNYGGTIANYGDFGGFFTTQWYNGTKYIRSGGFGFMVDGPIINGKIPSSLLFITSGQGEDGVTTYGNISMKISSNGNITMNKYTGTGNAAVCFNATGVLFRSTNATSNYLTC